MNLVTGEIPRGWREVGEEGLGKGRALVRRHLLKPEKWVQTCKATFGQGQHQ